MNPESFDVTFGVRFIYSDLDPIIAFSIQIAAILKFIINFASFIDYKL